jgi:hypothetical protein
MERRARARIAAKRHYYRMKANGFRKLKNGKGEKVLN